MHWVSFRVKRLIRGIGFVVLNRIDPDEEDYVVWHAKYDFIHTTQYHEEGICKKKFIVNRDNLMTVCRGRIQHTKCIKNRQVGNRGVVFFRQVIKINLQRLTFG